MAEAKGSWRWDRVRRSRDDRILTGLCGGLGRYFEVDAVVVRLAFLVLALANGLAVFAYLLGWITIPTEEPDDALTAQSHQARERILLGTAVAVLGLVLLADWYQLRMGVWVITAVAAAAGLLFLITGFRQRQQPERDGPAQEANRDAAASSQDSNKRQQPERDGPAQEANRNVAGSSQDSNRPLSRRRFVVGWLLTLVTLVTLAATDWVGNWRVPRFGLLPWLLLGIGAGIGAIGANLVIRGVGARTARPPAA
jgi:phage shock protein C